MNGPLNLGEDVALFIDWENFKISLATGRRTPNVSALKEEVSNLGRVVVAKAYADWVTRAPELKGASQFINDPPALYAAGIEPVYVPTRLPSSGGGASESGRNYRVKNSVDVKMTADCIECAHSYPNIGTYALVSGDSDFIHVVNTLRTMGKRVVIIGVSWATSRRLVDQVDGLILYDVDVDPVTPSEPAPAGNGRAPARSGSGSGSSGGGASRLDLGEVIREIEEIVRSERQVGGTPLLTSIKQRLMRRFPGFDEKQLGFSGFKKLMARAAQEGNIRLTTAGLVDWATMANEQGAVETAVETPSAGDARPAQGRGLRARLSGRAQPAEEPADAQEEEAGLTQAVAPPDVTPEVTEEYRDPQPDTKTASAVAAFLSESAAGLDLPEGPGDGRDAQRIADLIVMADTLEHREGISHVAFNFLAAEVCQALEAGLAAEDDEITQHWAQAYSRAYVGKLFRGLSNGELFLRGWHSWREEASGQNKRRRTFNLDRNHPVVAQVLKARWEPVAEAEPDDAATRAGTPVQEEPAAEYAGYAPSRMEETYHEEPPDDDADDADDAGRAGGAAKPAIRLISRLFRPRG